MLWGDGLSARPALGRTKRWAESLSPQFSPEPQFSPRALTDNFKIELRLALAEPFGLGLRMLRAMFSIAIRRCRHRNSGACRKSPLAPRP